MNLIHEIDPGVNYWPIYSVEWKEKTTGMWVQHGRTASKMTARFLAFEVWMRYRKNPRRVRVL